MKILIFFSVIIFSGLVVDAQSKSITNVGSAPDASNMLDVKNTTKGMLVTGMTTVQRISIATRGTGLLVFYTDNNGFRFYIGVAFNDLSAGSGRNSWAANVCHVYNSNTGNVANGANSPPVMFTVQTPINSLGFQHNGIDTL